jgi:hypothetical protein
MFVAKAVVMGVVARSNSGFDARGSFHDGLRFSPVAPFLAHKSPRIRRPLPRIFSESAMEVAVLRKPKSYQSESQYNAYLAGWAFAFSVLLVTFVLIAGGINF